MRNLSHNELNTYLHYGYIPRLENGRKILDVIRFHRERSQTSYTNNRSEDFYIHKGVKILHRIFDELLKGKEHEKHLIPLSGGLDSRLIFAALLDRVPAERIHTITFGSPGSWDYDIPGKLVKGTGVNWERIDCTQLDYSIDNLVRATKNGGQWSSTPDTFINRLSLKLDEDFHRWSGFFGGEITGSYFDLNLQGKDNYQKFADYQKRSKSITLTHPEYIPKSALLKVPGIPYNFSEFELIFLYNRTASGAIPILYPSEVDILTPFMHPDWVEFITMIPANLRKGGYLYKKIMLKMYPDWMSKSCKNNHGLGLGEDSWLLSKANQTKLKIRFEFTRRMKSIKYPPAGINYLYYEQAIKKIPSLRSAIEESCESLEKNQTVPWISPLSIFRDHLKGKSDHSQALLILLGLESNLRAKKDGRSLLNQSV